MVLLSIVLIGAVMAVYAQVGNHQFLNLDDNAYVTHNPYVTGGLTGKNISWAFTTIDYFYWQPVTWLSHMADAQFYGMNPRGHHLTNIILHTISALFIMLFLFRLTGELWQSSFVAFLFALHPQSVESVAWVAERKDVLSALFWFLTLILYVEFTAMRKPFLYVSALCFFVMGLMSKPMIVTLPVVMLLLDYWPLGRFRYQNQPLTLRKRLDHIRPLVLEKLPFFACSLFSVAITIFGHNQAGGLRGLNEISIWLRAENAIVSYVSYIGKAFLPLDLAVLYPFPEEIGLWTVICSLLILFAITVLVIRARHEQPYLVTGWFWFFLTLLPVIGLFQTGEQSMADRFSYIPRVGLFIMMAWGASELIKNMRYRNAVLVSVFGVIVITAAAVTWHQVGYWQDDLSLYQRTLQVTRNNYTIHNNLGLALAEKGDLHTAIQEYREALRIKPKNAFSHNNLGLALAKQGQLDEAIREYQQALLLSPEFTSALNNLGMALAGKGDLDAAISMYRQAIRINPDYADPLYNLGLVYARKGEFDAAIGYYNDALRITPDDIDTRNNLGTALAGKGQLDLAIMKFQEVLRVSPQNVIAQNNLNLALTQKRMLEGSGNYRTNSR